MKLKTKEIEIEGIKFKIRQLNANTVLSMSNLKDTEEIARKTLEYSVIEPKITKEFLEELPAPALVKLITEIRELNEGFMKVPEVLPSNQSGK